MPEFRVRLPLECVAEIVVEAESESEALTKAADAVTTGHIADWSVGSLGYAHVEPAG